MATNVTIKSDKRKHFNFFANFLTGPARADLSFGERLHLYQPAVVSGGAGSKQLFVSSGFDYAAFMEHAYEVGVAYGRQSVRYYQCGAVGHQAVECLLHQGLALAVESRCGFVEYEQCGIFENGSGYRQTLALSAR